MATIGIITARMGSTRLPGKPLIPILGKPMIQWVWERCSLASRLDELAIATESDDIRDAAQGFGARVVMTHAGHRNGTSRALEAAVALHCHKDDRIINIQGDEPLIHRDTVDALDLTSSGISSAYYQKVEGQDWQDWDNPNVVKVVTRPDPFMREVAVYFSRSRIPSGGGEWKKHIGVYAYQMWVLMGMVDTANRFRSLMAEAERLEQLAWLEDGQVIGMVRSRHDTVAVNTAEDIARVEAVLARGVDK